ncbi:hypothetical protein DL767_007239 [Monosporascus sp. MG133]|nr:hypothetical protein DL767_007239 [Monosporascus sp. MG133]
MDFDGHCAADFEEVHWVGNNVDGPKDDHEAVVDSTGHDKSGDWAPIDDVEGRAVQEVQDDRKPQDRGSEAPGDLEDQGAREESSKGKNSGTAAVDSAAVDCTAARYMDAADLEDYVALALHTLCRY